MTREGQIARRCRACGRLSRIVPPGLTCPACGVPFGRLVLGLDTDPAAARAMEQTRRANEESRMKERMDAVGRRDRQLSQADATLQPAQAPQPRPEETA